MIHKRMITLRQIIGALFHICVATATLSHGITYHEYSKIQSSEIDVEVDHIVSVYDKYLSHIIQSGALNFSY